MPFPKPDGSGLVWVREIVVPAISAGPDDDVLDVDPTWRWRRRQ